MKYVTLSDFIKIGVKPFLLGAFLSRLEEKEINGEKYFVASSAYKSSKFVFPSDFDFLGYTKDFLNVLNDHSGYQDWNLESASNTSAKYSFYVKIDIDNYSRNMFYDFLYSKAVASQWSLDVVQNDRKKDFIRGYMELRGSVDLTANYLTHDFFYGSKKEIKKAQILCDTMNIDYGLANFNSRELQPQYVSGENQRNSQFRIHLDYYASEIGFINDYKAAIYSSQRNIASVKSTSGITTFPLSNITYNKNDTSLVNYLNFYTNNIYSKSITEALVKNLRNQLGFSNGQPNPNSRNQLIISIYRQSSPDICAICGTTNTFTSNTSGTPYFQVHHVVSRFNGQNTDNIANLVKLCPTCHSMMKKGSGTVEDQIKANKKILTNHQEIYDYTSNLLNIYDIDDLAKEIQKLLG